MKLSPYYKGKRKVTFSHEFHLFSAQSLKKRPAHGRRSSIEYTFFSVSYFPPIWDDH
jgi:hypothetical protein